MSHTATTSMPSSRLIALVITIAAALLLPTGIAHAHADGGSHGHSHGTDDGRDPATRVKIEWDGTGTEDCRATGEGTILWTLTGSDAVIYAELHIDEPVFTVTVRDGGPYLWISPLYPLEEIAADVDWVDGPLEDGARLTATTCPEGGSAAAARSATDLLLPVGGGVLVGGVLGLLVGSRRRSPSTSA
jgi:hypothetical protein